jgi:hypothetical protein
MVALIEKELKTRDQELTNLLKDISTDSMPEITSKLDSINIEKEILNKLLKEQKLQRKRSLFALENGLLLFAIGMYGLLAAFVVYLVGSNAAMGTWQQVGSDLAVLVLLIVMSTMSTVLYFEYYKQRNNR